MMIPKPDEIELTVFGPGYGESIVIHVGSGKWAIVDSCLDENDEPAALAYLNKLGVPVEESVVSISASHWHDDHVKGLAKTIEACPNARLSLSAALRHSEFLAFLQVHENQPVQKLDRGGTELLKCLRHIKASGSSPKPLSEDTVVFDFDAHDLAHNCPVEMRALSPSGKQFADFLERIEQFPDHNQGQAKTRISEPSRNDLSVAMVFTVSERSVLFGADLEQVGDPQKGWKAVVEARHGRHPRSWLFKVPHHGSRNAHNQDVWNKLLELGARAVVTPWNKGGHHLPKDSDLVRLRKLSDKCYLTSTRRTVSSRRRYGVHVAKVIESAGVRLQTTEYSQGYVTVRWTPNEGSPDIQLFGGAEAA